MRQFKIEKKNSTKHLGANVEWVMVYSLSIICHTFVPVLKFEMVEWEFDGTLGAASRFKGT